MDHIRSVTPTQLSSAGGTPVTTLPGGTRSYKLPVDFNLDQASLLFQAELSSGQLSNQLQIIARRSSCEWPPPLTGIDRKGDLDLVFHGGNFLGEPTRCQPPTDFSVLPDLTSLGIREIRETSFSALRGVGGGGDLRSQASIITSYTRDRLENIALDPALQYVKRLATSFFTRFQQKLFEAILFTGSIGPIPVTVWGSVSLALGIDMLAVINVHVTPFAPVLNGGKYLESEVKFCSKLTLSLPAELRTDILFGVASLTLSFIVEAAANFDASLRATNTTLTLTRESFGSRTLLARSLPPTAIRRTTPRGATSAPRRPSDSPARSRFQSMRAARCSWSCDG